MTDKQPEVRSDIDKIYSAVIADSEALEDAKMTLEVIMKTDPGVYDEMINDTLSLIRKALSSSILSVVDRVIKVEIEMEPVAWMHDSHVGFNVPLYTAPPQREWQGLTDEEIEKLYLGSFDEGQFARAIEAKLREKNAPASPS